MAQAAACKTCFIDPEAFLADRIEYTNTNLHNTFFPFSLDGHVAAPVVVVGVGREGAENGPEEPRPAHAVARRDASDEPRPAGVSIQPVVPV